MATNSTSFSSTPQASDDDYQLYESDLIDSLKKYTDIDTGIVYNYVTFDVMSDDLGGKAKTIFSISDATGTALDVYDALNNADGLVNGVSQWETTAAGNHIRIDNGKIDFGIDALSKIDALAEGEGYTDTFTYAIRLGNGTLSWATVSITITGENDVAVIGDPTLTSVTEDVNPDISGNLTASGQISISDADTGQDHFQTTVTGALTNLGGLNLAADGSYTYSVANAAVQFLSGGSTHVDTFTVLAADGTSKDVSFTITGENDVAVIGDPTLTSVTEDGNLDINGNLTASGQISISDADAGQGYFQTTTTGALTNLGSLELAADGSYTYSVANEAVQFLTEPLYFFGEYKTLNPGIYEHVDTFTILAADGTSKDVSFTINGKNDVPVIGDIGLPASFTVKTGQYLDWQGYLPTIHDADAAQDYIIRWSVTGTPPGTVLFNESMAPDLSGARFFAAGRYNITYTAVTADYTSVTWETTVTVIKPPRGSLPAGEAGEPINLALADLDVNHVGLVTLQIIGMPADWTLSAGSRNADGSWTVETNDLGSLTVTTAASFAGAMMLNISQSWTNADGSIGSTVIHSNVEAYAAGNPIFALSDDDHLTGSTSANLFVFAQPIASNFIYNFDVVADKIDLIGFTGVNGYADLGIVNDANGNAVITTGEGQTITVMGVDAGALGDGNFAFNQEPVMSNSGTMTIADGAILPLGGIIDNSGSIMLDSTGSMTSLQILVESAKLQGGGQLIMSDDIHNEIFGGSADAILINVDNTISGAGQIGAGQMTLLNSGTIIADGNNALVIDTGSNAVINSGTLEATGNGGLIIYGDLSNSGLFWANDGDITITGNVSGNGSALLDGMSTIEFGGASSTNTTFAEIGDGTLKLDLSSAFTGVVSGFNEGDYLDIADVLSGPDTKLVFATNLEGTGGTLTVSDGTHTANINMQGEYSTEGFHMSADSISGMLISYMPLETQQSPLI